MESWLDTIRQNNKVFINSFKKDTWKPSNWENIQNNPHCEDYKNIFLKLRYNGHIHDNSYFDVLKRFETRYRSDKELQKMIDRYLKLTEMNYRSMKKGGWKNPFADIKFIGPWPFKIASPCVVDTELGKEYKRLEFELKEIFNKI